MEKLKSFYNFISTIIIFNETSGEEDFWRPFFFFFFFLGRCSNRARDTLDPIATIFGSFNSFNFLLSDFRVISRQSGCKVFKYIFPHFHSFPRARLVSFISLDISSAVGHRPPNYSKNFPSTPPSLSLSLRARSLTKQSSPPPPLQIIKIPD